MKLLNLTGPQDVLALLVRRMWWILLPFAALSVAVLLISTMLPEMYVSQSLIIIRPRDVPTDFVKDLIAGTTGERLSVITDRVLSDSNLGKTLAQFEGQLPEFQRMNRQEQILKLRKQIGLKFSADNQVNRAGLPVTSFRISCQNHNPLIAQKIVKQLTEIFISEDRRNREANVNETATFLQNQVDDLAVKLGESDTILKGLRLRRRDELPNQLDSNLRRLESLVGENQSLRRERTNYVLAQGQLEQQMSETPKQIPKPKAPVIPKRPPSRDPKIDAYRAAVMEERALRAKGNGDNYPAMLLAKSQIQQLEQSMTPQQLALAKAEDTPEAPELEVEEAPEMQNNPAYSNMDRNLQFLKKQIDDIDIRVSQNDIAIGKYNLHVNNAPQGEQELTDILRTNNDLNRQYQEMSTKLAAARLSESAENQQKGSQFEVIDPASLPLSPTKPSKLSFVGAGILASFVISLGIAFVVDLSNQKMWTQADVVWLVGTKVLVEIPQIAMRSQIALNRRKKIGFLASLGIGAVAYALCLYVASLHPGFVLQQLDPLIQRFY